MIEDIFHSSRKERLSRASKEVKQAYEKRNSKNFFKKNPHLKILLIDLVIVLLFAAVIVPFFYKLTKDIRVDNYKIESEALSFEGQIIIRLKIIRLNKKNFKRLTTDSLKVAIISEIGKKLEEKSVKLPDIDEEVKYLTFKLDDNQKMQIINIELLSGNFTKEYKVRIER